MARIADSLLRLQVNEIHSIRPETAAGADAALAAGIARKPKGARLAYFGVACAIISLALAATAPRLLFLTGDFQLLMFAVAILLAATSFIACLVAAIMLRHSLTPAKLAAWATMPLAIFLLWSFAAGAAWMSGMSSGATRTDAKGRFIITRPDAEWVFLPAPILGENSAIEMAHLRGARLHVSVRTGKADNAVKAAFNEMYRIARLPSLWEEEESAEHEEKSYTISSVQVVLGDATAELVKRLFAEAADKNSATLARTRNDLRALEESHGSVKTSRV